MLKVNYENASTTMKVNEATKEGFPQSSYEDVEGDKIKRLKRLVNHKATAKVQNSVKGNCVAQAQKVAFGHIEPTATETFPQHNTAEHSTTPAGMQVSTSCAWTKKVKPFSRLSFSCTQLCPQGSARDCFP